MPSNGPGVAGNHKSHGVTTGPLVPPNTMTARQVAAVAVYAMSVRFGPPSLRVGALSGSAHWCWHPMTGADLASGRDDCRLEGGMMFRVRLTGVVTVDGQGGVRVRAVVGE